MFVNCDIYIHFRNVLSNWFIFLLFTFSNYEEILIWTKKIIPDCRLFCYGDAALSQTGPPDPDSKTRPKKLLTLNLPSRRLGLPPGES